MKRIDDIYRMKRLIDETISNINLDLNGMNVLTEAASGNFIVTPLIAAASGANKVFVTCKDSIYGTKEEIIKYLYDISSFFDFPKDIIELTDNKNDIAQNVNIVTNSGHVRPIDDLFISRLPYDAAISLMFESWEFRKDDIDVRSCIHNNIPILGTNENEKNLNIFKYVSMSIIKLLLEQEIEVFKSNILLISSGDYLKETQELLEVNGANVKVIDTYNNVQVDFEEEIQSFDAIVFAEQSNTKCLLGDQSDYIRPIWLKNCSIKIIHIAGVIDYDELNKLNIKKYPPKEIPYGYMTVTTDYVGFRPVIELNAAGLKVGQEMVLGMRKYNDYMKAQQYALRNDLAMMFDMSVYS